MSRLTVFPKIERSYDGPAYIGEGSFTSLNRSALAEDAETRDMIEDWFSSYPREGQAELQARFKNDNNPEAFDSAFFELFLHEYLRRSGCVLSLHPDMSNSHKRPDFLVTMPSGSRFYLEAKVASGMSQQDRALRNRTSQLYNALNELSFAGYFIGVSNTHLSFEKSIPVRKVQNHVTKWIESLHTNRGNARSEVDKFTGLPVTRFEHDGSSIEFVAIKKKGQFLEPDTRNLASYGALSQCVDPREEIHSALKKKFPSRYGKPELPYLVAVHFQQNYLRSRDVEDTLYGFRDRENLQDMNQLQFTNLQSGIWATPRGAEHCSLSGVIAVHHLYPWNLRPLSILLFLNPWAHCKFELDGLRLPRERVVSERACALSFRLPSLNEQQAIPDS